MMINLTSEDIEILKLEIFALNPFEISNYGPTAKFLTRLDHPPIPFLYRKDYRGRLRYCGPRFLRMFAEK